MKAPARRGRRKGSKDGDGATKPLPFTITYSPGSTGAIKVSVGRRVWSEHADEVVLLAPAIITPFPAGGLIVSGNGVVRKDRRTIRVTA